MTNSPTNNPGDQPQGGGKSHPQHLKATRVNARPPKDDASQSDTVPLNAQVELDDPLEPASNAGTAEVRRVRKKRKKKMSHGKKAALIVVICIVALVAIAGAAFAYSTYKASKEAHDYGNVEVTAPAETEAVTYSNGKTVEYNGHTYQLNENMVSMVFMGVDKSQLQEAGEPTGQADAIMVVSLDTSTGAVHVISIPRDSMVEVDTYDSNGTSTGIQTMQISLAFDYGNGSDTSAENVRKAASRVLYNIPIKYYFALNEDGIGAMCDSIGGVALTALDDIPDVGITEGENVILTGDDALRYVQYRDITDLNSPLARQERQKQFIKAFAQQVLAQTHGSVNNLVDLYNTALEYSTTNLTSSDFSYLALSVVNNGISDVNVTSLTGTMTQGETYAEFNLDDAATYQTVLDTYYTQVD